jgi:hypothetical protein
METFQPSMGGILQCNRKQVLDRSQPPSSKKALADHEGLFAYFDSCAWDLMRWSRAKNSAVSSSIDFEGGLGARVSLQTLVEPRLGYTPRCRPFLRAIGAFLRRKCAAVQPGRVEAVHPGDVMPHDPH